MANETVLTGIGHPTNVVSDAISASLTEEMKLVPLIYSENLPANTTIKLLRKAGTIATPSDVAEVGDASSLAAYTETFNLSVTATKLVTAAGLSVEAEQFSNADIAMLAREQGRAIGRALDAEILALFSGFSGGVTATSVLTVEDILQAAYLVRSGVKSAGGARALRFVGDYKGIYEIQKQLIQSAASVFTLDSQISLLKGVSTVSGYRGMLPGVEVFETSGLATSNGDDVALCFDPDLAFFGMYADSVRTETRWIGAANPGCYTEVVSIFFHDVAEWNDAAGVMVKSDT